MVERITNRWSAPLVESAECLMCKDLLCQSTMVIHWYGGLRGDDFKGVFCSLECSYRYKREVLK